MHHCSSCVIMIILTGRMKLYYDCAFSGYFQLASHGNIAVAFKQYRDNEILETVVLLFYLA